MKKVVKAVLVCAPLALLVGCSSLPTRIGAIPEKKYDVIGKGKANGGGFMLFHFIPIMHNDKVARTYKAAVAQQKGDDLINIVITENWFWAYIGNGYRTTIEGDVIKYK